MNVLSLFIQRSWLIRNWTILSNCSLEHDDEHNMSLLWRNLTRPKLLWLQYLDRQVTPRIQHSLNIASVVNLVTTLPYANHVVPTGTTVTTNPVDWVIFKTRGFFFLASSATFWFCGPCLFCLLLLTLCLSLLWFKLCSFTFSCPGSFLQPFLSDFAI